MEKDGERHRRPSRRSRYRFFFFNDTATTEIYTLSLHDALPICTAPDAARIAGTPITSWSDSGRKKRTDRKSTRLNSSHSQISYAVFCLKKKKTVVILIITNVYKRVNRTTSNHSNTT